MNLESLSDENLLMRTEQVAAETRATTTNLLLHLGEVEQRRLFAKVGCSSLFDYCVRVLRMSEPQAGRRVTAARALREFPDIEEKINSGSLTLSAISQAQTFFRNESKTGFPIENEIRRDILRELENKTSRQAEKLLLGRSSKPETFIRERIRQISQSITEIKCGLDEETMDNLMRLREIWSYELPEANHSQLIKKSSSFCREKLDPIGRKGGFQHAATPAPESRCTKGRGAGETVATANPNGKANPNARANPNANGYANDRPIRDRSRYIPADVRRQVWLRDNGCCTYIDASSGRRCEARYRLNLDHIVPFAKGGLNSVANLRLRCFSHNQWHAMEAFGPDVLKYTSRRSRGDGD